MKITEVVPHLLTVDLADGAFTALTSSLRYYTVVLAEVKTDEGLSGLGECYAGLFAPEPAGALISTLGQLLLGQDSDDIEELHTRMCSKSLFWARAGLPLSAIGCIENALWDLKGKAAGQPVWKLLGGVDPDPIKVYASGGLGADLDLFVRELEEYLTEGYRAVKIRVWGTLEEDSAKMKLARRVLGDDVHLMVDGVMGHNPNPWTGEEALLRAKVMEELNVTWFEEPCGNRDYEGYAHVREKSSVPVAGGESAIGFHEFKSFFDAEALDWVQPDTSHSGGIIECQRIAAEARQRGVKVVYHSWGAAPCLLANYHLAFSEEESYYLEYPTHRLSLIQELAVKPFRLVNGCFEVPRESGLGVHLPEGVLQKSPFRPGTGFWT